MNVKTLRRIMFFGTLCAIVLAGCTAKEKTKTLKVIPENTSNNNEMSTEQNPIVKTSKPTLFVHGYKGNLLSFRGMIHRLVRRNDGSRSVVINVGVDGTITEEGTWSGSDNPLIQVVFEDNTNHEWQQAEWLQRVLTYINEQYQVTSVNLVGHSMGGVSIMRYLASFGENGSNVIIEKVVTIGSPFNDFNEDTQTLEEITANGPEIIAPRFDEYAKKFENIPKTIPFLTIAGDIHEDGAGDGTVPLGSVASINHLFKQFHIMNQFEVVTGTSAQHSALHENKEVDQLVIDFLWKE